MSLELDPRQRAMLQEMGVRVWQPLPEQAPVVAAVEVKAAPAVPVMKPADKPLPAQTVAPVVAPVQIADTTDWSSLAQTVMSCQACKLCAGRRAPVFASAQDVPSRADWMVVGEPPDEAEERAGVPMVGPAGQLLDNMLKAVGVSRQISSVEAADAFAPAHSAYVSHVVKCRPAVVRNPTMQDLAACETYLRQEVSHVQPKVILAMGRFAAHSLLRQSLPDVASIPLGKLRGQVHRYQGVPVIVTYHPAYLLRTPQDKARAWTDLCLAMAQLRGLP